MSLIISRGQGEGRALPPTSGWRSCGRWLATGVVVTVLCLALSVATGIVIQLQGGAFSQGVLTWAQELVGLGDPGSGSDTPWWLLVLFVQGVVGVAVGLLILATGLLKGATASARAARKSRHLARGAAAAAEAGHATIQYSRATVERAGPRLGRTGARIRAVVARRRSPATPELTAAGVIASADGAAVRVNPEAELEME